MNIVVIGTKSTLKILENQNINILSFVEKPEQIVDTLSFYKPKKVVIYEILWCKIENKKFVLDAEPLLKVFSDFYNIMKNTAFDNKKDKVQTLTKYSNVFCFFDVFSSSDIVKKINEIH